MKILAAKKKTVKKKTKVAKKDDKIEVSIIRQYNKEAPFESHFVLTDGRRIKTIFELIDILDNMSDEIFKFHVSTERNDFSNWIEGVFNEEELAKKIGTLSSRLETQNELLKHLIKKLT